ncbi:DUF805 domain-containing protein [Kiloniella majae]|uniref:DUF805 domain-containing protein n=1 Tax=Kiloniella majae TaxID=1938558 RepID=UPI000A277FA9|nr:DUF805 domain-containing protein [Kiloniella majae]
MTNTTKNNFSWKWFFFSGKGRITRKQFWFYYIPYLLLTFCIVILDNRYGYYSDIYKMQVITTVFGIVTLYPCFAVTIKRFHDRGKSGLWSIIAFFPFLGWPWIFIDCGLLRGTKGPNDYGPDQEQEKRVIEAFD